MDNKKVGANSNWVNSGGGEFNPQTNEASQAFAGPPSDRRRSSLRNFLLDSMESGKPPGKYFYSKTDLIGRGTSAKIYRGLALTSNSKVALKVHLKSKDEEFPSDFLRREAHLMRRLRHPNLVSFVDFVETPEKAYIVMEYSARGSLFDKIYSRRRFRQKSLTAGPKEQRPMPESQVFRYFLQVSLALEHLHSRGVIHRDLKPENILCFPKGLLKLSDFGSAFDMRREFEESLLSQVEKSKAPLVPQEIQKRPRPARVSGSNRPQGVSAHSIPGTLLKPEKALARKPGPSKRKNLPGTFSGVSTNSSFKFCEEAFNNFVRRRSVKRKTFCGTLDYMSPEALLGKAYDYKVDLWALGVLLFELLHRKTPFDAETQVETIEKILALDLSFGNHVSKPAAELVLGLLHPNPGQRFCFDEIYAQTWMRRHSADFGLNMDRLF